MDTTPTFDPAGFVVGERPCTWCHAPFPIVRRPGRPRLYCDHACRQRAYEHRHGFTRTRTVVPLPGQAPGDPKRGSGYERGAGPVRDGRFHAMRTAVRPEGGRRETVCGVLVKPQPGWWFSPGAPNSCLTCSSVVEAHPLTHGINSSNELSRLRALIQEGLEHRHRSPRDLLRWLTADATRAA